MCVSSVIKLVAQLTLGSATSDGKPVIGHQTFTEFWNGQYMNLILDIDVVDVQAGEDADSNAAS